MVEHLEKSSPLIMEEVVRWHDLIWEDWQVHHAKQEGRKKTEDSWALITAKRNTDTKLTAKETTERAPGH